MEATMANKKRNIWVVVIPAVILVMMIGAAGAVTVLASAGSDKVLTQDLAVPLGDATAARYDLNVGTGNLTINPLSSGEQLLARAELEYLEGQERPSGTVDMNGQLYTLTIKAGGGNLQLNLAGMALTSVAAETSGGNVDVVLPEGSSGLAVSAKTGGGNVVVHLPGGTAARISAASGLGKLLIDPQFEKIDDHTYQSPGYADAINKIDITAESGAGNVEITTK